MQTVETHDMLAHDDTGGDGPLVVLLPGAGDIRTEYRFMTEGLSDAGFRVVTADLPGHGESPLAARYGVAETAGSVLALIRHLGAGPAVIVGCSFAPAAAIHAAAESPGDVSGIVLISPHLEGPHTFGERLQSLAASLGLRGPWAGKLWAKLYRGWYKSVTPEDLDEHVDRLAQMLAYPARRKAVRHTLLADRTGLAERVSAVTVPTLTVFGSSDDHFEDPAGEATRVAELLGGETLLVEGAGHYPHVERPRQVLAAMTAFLS